MHNLSLPLSLSLSLSLSLYLFLSIYIYKHTEEIKLATKSTEEKLYILQFLEINIYLIKEFDLISKCRHKNKYLLRNLPEDWYHIDYNSYPIIYLSIFYTYIYKTHGMPPLIYTAK